MKDFTKEVKRDIMLTASKHNISDFCIANDELKSVSLKECLKSTDRLYSIISELKFYNSVAQLEISVKYALLNVRSLLTFKSKRNDEKLLKEFKILSAIAYELHLRKNKV